MRANAQSDRPRPQDRRVLPDRRRNGVRRTLCLAALAIVSIAGPSTLHAGAPGPDDQDIDTPYEDEATPSEPMELRPGFPGQRDESMSDSNRTKRTQTATATPLDPAARLLEGDDASEYWTLYVELDSGHRITQRFLLSNTGPGNHNAVAIGHLIEPGRAPYRYENGRRRARWTLSDDRLDFDISASHLVLQRPTGQLRITKDDIEIRLFFDFPGDALAGRVPEDRLPKNYHVEVLAVAAATRGTILAPWMSVPLEVRGRTWLAHTWTRHNEASLIDRRVEIYGYEDGTSFYGIQVRRGKSFSRAWLIAESNTPSMVESLINVPASWVEIESTRQEDQTASYAIPRRFEFSRGPNSGRITLGNEWLRFDPLAVIPQPFRWFIRRKTKPREVWADAQIGVRLLSALESPPLPDSSEIESDSNSERETEEETAERSVTGVASITFMNPSEDR